MFDFLQLLLEQQESTPRQLSILIGLALSASELLPLGKSSLCPLLWLLAHFVSGEKVLDSAHSSLSKDETFHFWSALEFTTQDFPRELVRLQLPLVGMHQLQAWVSFLSTSLLLSTQLLNSSGVFPIHLYFR